MNGLPCDRRFSGGVHPATPSISSYQLRRQTLFSTFMFFFFLYPVNIQRASSRASLVDPGRRNSKRKARSKSEPSKLQVAGGAQRTVGRAEEPDERQGQSATRLNPKWHPTSQSRESSDVACVAFARCFSLGTAIPSDRNRKSEIKIKIIEFQLQREIIRNGVAIIAALTNK